MKKNILYLVLVIFVIHSQAGFAQMKTADKLYERFAYSRAIPYYLKIINSKDATKKESAVSKLADCYRHINSYEQAARWYQEAVANENAEAINYFYLGIVLRNLSQYDEAKKAFLTYSKLVSSDQRGQKFAAFCDEIQKWNDEFVSASIENKQEINSGKSDFSPVLYKGGLVFTSDRGIDLLDNNNYTWTGNAYLDLYFSKPGESEDYLGKMSIPEKLPNYINQPYHDGPACFTKDNNMIFVTRTHRGTAKSEKMRIDLLDIYYADLHEKKPDFIPFPCNSDSYSVGHPAISPDGLKLIFSSDMPGGEGGSDLYLSKLNNGEWTTPENLGAIVNTFGDEVFPSWDNDSTLYFSSDSRMGYGGLDIYKTVLINKKWSTPVNLRSPINSSYDDFGIVFISNASGFFSSNRPGGKGSDDIYQFSNFHLVEGENPKVEVENKKKYISGFVKDNESGSPINESMVFLYDTSSDDALMVKTNAKGYYELPVKTDKNYVVKAVKEQYFNNCFSFKTRGIDGNIKKTELGDLLLTRYKVDKTFKVGNIYYNLDSWEIRNDAKIELDKLVRLLNQYPISVEIGSHTDCRGSEEYNEVLSLKRAEAVRSYLISKGISANRITAKGYGESKPLNNCIDGVPCTEEEYQFNRRTEFKITDIDSSSMKQNDFSINFKNGDKIPLNDLGDGFFDNCRETQY